MQEEIGMNDSFIDTKAQKIIWHVPINLTLKFKLFCHIGFTIFKQGYGYC